MSDYQLTRDAHVRPLYEFTTELATLEPSPPQVQQLLRRMVGNQAVINAFTGIIAGTDSPAEFFAPDHIERLMQADLLATYPRWQTRYRRLGDALSGRAR
jgi:hypothetical protein